MSDAKFPRPFHRPNSEFKGINYAPGLPLKEQEFTYFEGGPLDTKKRVDENDPERLTSDPVYIPRNTLPPVPNLRKRQID